MLVRSTLEYAASIWNPDLAKDCDLLEKLQWRSARFVKGDLQIRLVNWWLRITGPEQITDTNSGQ